MSQRRRSDIATKLCVYWEYHGFNKALVKKIQTDIVLSFQLNIVKGTRNITKTYLYNFDPLKPHFYTVKQEFTGVNIIFLISAQKHRLWVLVRTASARRF